MLNAKELIKQYELMMADHRLWRPTWQDLSDYIIPKRSQFTTKRTAGQKQTERLFDSTALNACDRLASTINGTLTSRAVKWFSLTLEDEELAGIKEVDDWLEDCSKRMFKALNRSNFAKEIAEVYQDLVGLGTGALFEEERKQESPVFNGFIFTAIALHDYAIEENAEGKVDTLFRTFQLSAVAIIRRWGRNVGEKIRKRFDEGHPEELFTILHAVLPREPRMVKLGGANTKLPFASAWVCMEDKYLMNESGFHEFPYMVPRWSKTSGEKYGRGPGFLALPDVKTLNKIEEKVLKATAKAVDPPTKTLNEMIVGTIRNTGGGNTVVRGDIENIQPLFQPGYFDSIFRSEQIKTSDLRLSIEKIFMADQIQLPPPVANTTAYEIAKRFEQAQRILGPSMGSIEVDLLQDIVRRTFNAMYRKRAFKPAPQVLVDKGAEIVVQYQGPLARSQRLTEAEGFEQLANSAIQIAQVDPSVIDLIDWDYGIKLLAEVRGVPAKVLRDAIEVKRIRDGRAQQMAEQQRMADAGKMAEAAGKAAPALQLVSGGAKK